MLSNKRRIYSLNVQYRRKIDTYFLQHWIYSYTYLYVYQMSINLHNRCDDSDTPTGSTANPQASSTDTCMTQALTSCPPSSNRVPSPLATNTNNNGSSSSNNSSNSNSRPQVGFLKQIKINKKTVKHWKVWSIKRVLGVYPSAWGSRGGHSLHFFHF